MQPDASPERHLHLAGFLRAHREAILDVWERAARSVPIARTLARGDLRDHLPEMLDRIADMADDLASGTPIRSPDHESSVHAADRLSEGYALSEVVKEYELLRDCIFEMLESDPVPRLTLGEVRLLNRAIGQAVELTAQRYAETRDRTLKAIDALTSKGLTSTTLEDLLAEMLRSLFESVPAVDSAAILLREGERITVRAAAGISEGYRGFSLGIGEGFAGEIARTRRDLFLSDGSHDPIVVGEHLKRSAIRALYGVPLLHGEELVGVAHIGSTTAFDFSDGDRVLFRAMAARVTSLIAQARTLQREQEARSEAERALAQVNALLEASPLAIAFLDRGLRYLRVNPETARLNALPRGEHSGKSLREVVPEDVAPLLETTLQRVLDSGAPIIGMELTTSAPDGDPRTLLGNYFPVKGASGEVLGVGAMVSDITERKRDEQERARLHAELEVEHARFEALVRQLPVGVIVAESPTGALVFGNAQAERLLGHPVLETHQPSDYAQYRARHLDGTPFRAEEYPMVRALGGEQVSGELMRYPQPGGSERFLMVAGTPVDASSGARVGAVITIQDVTDLKRVENELRTSLEFQEQVMGILGHDLRTPLSVITTSAALMLRSGELAPKQARLAGRVADNAERMARMISDLLDYTRARGPGLPLHRHPVNLRHLARHAIEELGVAFPTRVVRLASADDTHGQWDPDRLSQVVHNLLGNALRYSPEDTPVDVAVKDGGDRVVLSVHNEGSPIPPEHLPTLFEPFRRGPGEQRTPEGLGLGLFIVRELVRAHGGEVEVSSTAEEGTTFTVRLPRGPLSASSASPPS